MAAQQFEHSADIPVELLAAAMDATDLAWRAEIARFRIAAEWADLHPVESIWDAATVEGTEGELALAGPGAPLVAEFCIDELALALQMTTDAGQRYLGEAVEVRHRLPRLWARVIAGQVPVWVARKIADQTMTLSRRAAYFVDRHLAPTAHQISWAQVERVVDAARAEYDPEDAERRRLAAADRRHLTVETGQASTDGTVEVHGEMDLADAIDLDHALSHGAKQLADLGSEESLDVRRAKAAGALARGDLTLDMETDTDTDEGAEPAANAKPRRRGRELVIYTHLSDRAVAGVENTQSHVLVTQIREWCATGTGPVTIKPVIDLDEHIEVPGYKPSARLREQVILTHPTCVHPRCRRKARRCDLDHVIPYEQGGPTCSCNLVPLCRRHHRAKTHGGWKLQRVGHRLFVWTSPRGKVYLRHSG